ncbi:hypothetical protein GW17_00025569 [Ensete ventricosum]|nr:hypothetical protein GW17_00025569 [Ensete ventricosum]
MARPFARVTDHGHTPCRGGKLWPRLRGQPPATRPQGAAARGAPARTSRQRPALPKFEVTFPELLNTLRGAENAIKKEKPVLYIGETKKKMKASKSLKKGKGKERPGKIKVVKKDPAKDKG